VSDNPSTPPATRSAPPKPLWRQAYDAVDSRLAPQLESLVQTKQFAQVLSLSWRAQTEARHFVERRTRELWHLMNLPAGSDVARLRDQVVTLDRRVRKLNRALEEANRRAQPAEPVRNGRGGGGTYPPRSRAQRTSRP
jgi:hypothetical protein